MNATSLPHLRLAAAILVIAAAAGGVVSASAATLGGVTTSDLGALDARLSTIPGVTVHWTPAAQGADWIIGGATVAANGGAGFLPGDVLRLTLDFGASPAPCEAVQTVATAASSVTLAASAFDGCRTRVLDKIEHVAVSLAGTQAAASASGRIGPVQAELFTAAGAFIDPARTLAASATTVTVSGTAYASLAIIDVPTGATVASLTGARASIILTSATGTQLAAFDGAITTGASDPIRVVTDPLGLGHAYPSIVIDLRANRTQTQWIRAADLATATVAVTTPQSLGTGGTSPAAATAASVLRASVAVPTSAPGSALDPIDLDPRLGYTMPAGETDNMNGLTFCHSFTVTNHSGQSVQWSLTFDTSKAPLYGLDPTSPGAFSSTWGFVTTAYSASTHHWTISGAGGGNVIGAGQSLQGGYCAQNVPVPPIDPSTFSVAVSVDPGSGPYYVALRITVTSTSEWNVPWQSDIDLGQYVCAASLSGHPVTFNRATGALVSGTTTTYRVAGVDGDTRFVSATQPHEFDFASYSPNGAAWSLPCTG